MPATNVNVDEVKVQLAKLLERALNGEEIVFAKRGQPLAKLIPLRPPAKKRGMGFAKFTVGANF